MKKFTNLFISNLLLVLLITSCASTDIYFDRYTYDVINNDTYESFDEGSASKSSSYSPLTYLNNNNVTESISDFDELYRSQNYLHKINSTGNSKILVIPVDFIDYSCDNLSHGCRLGRTLIQNAFFGKSKSNQYESVASYFDKSSYGKLKIDGKVTDWFRPTVTYADLLDKNTPKSVVLQIYNQALTWYQIKYGDLSSYYINGDKNLGLPIYFIYSAPADISENGPSTSLWAYTFNSDSLVSWTSYSMLNIDAYNKPDSHTLIHETGHLLGLNDYYATNGNYSPTGRIDMMDYSLGDETGLSKMLLNWTRPVHVYGSTTYTIRPFSKTGDLILLNNNWNKSQMDEYLLLEYYTPDELNEIDAKSNNSEAKLPSNRGLKVYHVDARAAFFQNKTKAVGYVSDGKYNKNNYRVGIVHSNSISSGNEFTKYPLYQLLEKSGDSTFLNGGIATDETLFHEGDSFGINTFIDYKFHNGESLGISFKVDSMTKDSVTISFNLK